MLVRIKTPHLIENNTKKKESSVSLTLEPLVGFDASIVFLRAGRETVHVKMLIESWWKISRLMRLPGNRVVA